MRHAIAKHYAGRGYNSPLEQVKKNFGKFYQEEEIPVGPRNEESKIQKGRERVNKLRENTVGPSGTDIDITPEQHASLKKEQNFQRREEHYR
jgi:hypothetical protein